MTPTKPDGAYVETEIDGERVLLGLEAGHFHALSGVGLAIWETIDGDRSLAALQAAMADRYAVDRVRGDAEVAAFVDQLRSVGFVDAR